MCRKHWKIEIDCYGSCLGVMVTGGGSDGQKRKVSGAVEFRKSRNFGK